jgi:hypothetical protein
MQPFLARFAVPRLPAPVLKGSYSPDADQWVMEIAAQAVPVIDDARLVTETRVGGEANDATAAASAFLTDTAVGGEQFDAVSDQIAMVTLTEVGGEQNDATWNALATITVTKVGGEMTDR